LELLAALASRPAPGVSAGGGLDGKIEDLLPISATVALPPAIHVVRHGQAG
jgi:hypothetical protein